MIKGFLLSLFILPLVACGGGNEVDQSELRSVISKSTDYKMHRELFENTAAQVIRVGFCSMEDFRKHAGWERSVNAPYNYFVYCGGLDRTDRLYLNVMTGAYNFGDPA